MDVYCRYIMIHTYIYILVGVVSYELTTSGGGHQLVSIIFRVLERDPTCIITYRNMNIVTHHLEI